MRQEQEMVSEGLVNLTQTSQGRHGATAAAVTGAGNGDGGGGEGEGEDEGSLTSANLEAEALALGRNWSDGDACRIMASLAKHALALLEALEEAAHRRHVMATTVNRLPAFARRDAVEVRGRRPLCLSLVRPFLFPPFFLFPSLLTQDL